MHVCSLAFFESSQSTRARQIDIYLKKHLESKPAGVSNKKKSPQKRHTAMPLAREAFRDAERRKSHFI